ncbi:hypothetical protein [Rhodopirellula europaea]|uniref:hypothetical protein n=1 Tax=Rhodopirellula europaea TaxID=1263866 RepID=UPI0005869D1E|nr:hypothetical protein [Rhodopirellula europaea]
MNAHAGVEEPIDQFFETQRAKRLGATCVEYFSGLPSSVDIFAPRAIELAIDYLRRLDGVGRLDDLASFKELVRDQLGVALRIGRENTARKKSGSDKMNLAPGLRERIEMQCTPDLAAWGGLFDA